MHFLGQCALIGAYAFIGSVGVYALIGSMCSDRCICAY